MIFWTERERELMTDKEIVFFIYHLFWTPLINLLFYKYNRDIDAFLWFLHLLLTVGEWQLQSWHTHVLSFSHFVIRSSVFWELTCVCFLNVGPLTSANQTCFSLWFPFQQPKCDSQQPTGRKKGHVSLQNIQTVQRRGKKGETSERERGRQNVFIQAYCANILNHNNKVACRWDAYCWDNLNHSNINFIT